MDSLNDSAPKEATTTFFSRKMVLSLLGVACLIYGVSLIFWGCATRKDAEKLSQEHLNINKDIETLSKQSSQGQSEINKNIWMLSDKISENTREASTTRSTLEAEYTQLSESVKQGLEQAAKENKDCIARALQAEYEIKSNSAYAKEAMTLAQSAIQNKQYDLAKIYALNAINHIPYEITYLELYFDLISNKLPGTLLELRQLINIIDVAVYQINPESISKVVGMKQSVMQTIAKLEAQEKEEANAAYETELNRALEELSNGRLSWEKLQKSNGHVNAELLNQRIETIKSILNDGVTNKTQYLQEDLDKATLVYQLEITLTAAENSIQKSEVITNTNTSDQKNLVIAQNQLQTASSLLSQIWTMDCTKAPGYLNRAEQDQKQIGTIDTLIKKLASNPMYEKVIDLINQINANSNGSYTSRIKNIGEKVSEIQKLLAEINYVDYQKEITEKLKGVEQKAQSYSKDRYHAYQQWALEKLQACHKKYTSYNVVTDARGDELFTKYLLDINPALLNYDMQSLYNSIYQKVYDEVSDKAKMQILKAEHTCKSLEDF